MHRGPGRLVRRKVRLGLVGPISFLVGLAPIRLLARLLIGITNVIVPGKGLRQGPFSTPEELIELADAALEDAVLEHGIRAGLHRLVSLRRGFRDVEPAASFARRCDGRRRRSRRGGRAR